jgi:hypothetical protein
LLGLINFTSATLVHWVAIHIPQHRIAAHRCFGNPNFPKPALLYLFIDITLQRTESNSTLTVIALIRIIGSMVRQTGLPGALRQPLQHFLPRFTQNCRVA